MATIASFPKNSREEVQISLDEFNGQDLINMRVWYRTESGELRPGKQGLALRVELFTELLAALEGVRQVLDRESEAA